MPRLCLTRRPGESILIGDNVTMTILKVQGNHVKLSIEAPRQVDIMRGELLRKQPEDLETRYGGTD